MLEPEPKPSLRAVLLDIRVGFDYLALNLPNLPRCSCKTCRPACRAANFSLRFERSDLTSADSAAMSWSCLSSMFAVSAGEKILAKSLIKQFSIANTAMLLMKTEMAV